MPIPIGFCTRWGKTMHIYVYENRNNCFNKTLPKGDRVMKRVLALIKLEVINMNRWNKRNAVKSTTTVYVLKEAYENNREYIISGWRSVIVTRLCDRHAAKVILFYWKNDELNQLHI